MLGHVLGVMLTRLLCSSALSTLHARPLMLQHACCSIRLCMPSGSRVPETHQAALGTDDMGWFNALRPWQHERGRGLTASSMLQMCVGPRSWKGECAKKQTWRLQWLPSVHSCVRYLEGCRLRSYTPCAYGHCTPYSSVHGGEVIMVQQLMG